MHGQDFIQNSLIHFIQKVNDNQLQDLDAFSFFKTINKYVNKELLAIIKIAINKKKNEDISFKKPLIKKNFDKIIQR